MKLGVAQLLILVIGVLGKVNQVYKLWLSV